MKDLETKVRRYEQLLQELDPELSPRGKAILQNALAETSENSAWPSTFESGRSEDSRHFRRPSHSSDPTGSEDDVESHEEGDAQTDTAIDDLATDINTLSINQPMGFMGRGSEVSWLRMLHAELNMNESEASRAQGAEMRNPSSSLAGMGVHKENSSCATYHLDDIDISLKGEFGQTVSPYELPPKDVADHYIKAYFETVHPLLPTINKKGFMQNYNTIYQYCDPHVVGNDALTDLNLIFAIGARFYESMGHTIGAQHIIFFIRARILGALDGGALFGIATLHDVQVMCLAGVYLLASKHNNR